MALNHPIPGNQNYLFSSQGLTGTNWEDTIPIVKKNFPSEVIEKLFRLNGEQASASIKIDSSKTEKTFGMEFQSYEQQVFSLVENYIELANRNT